MCYLYKNHQHDDDSFTNHTHVATIYKIIKTEIIYKRNGNAKLMILLQHTHTPYNYLHRHLNQKLFTKGIEMPS